MRNHLDFYETPPWQTKALRRRVNITGSVFECCVGDRSIANVFDDVKMVTNDIDRTRRADHHFDATKLAGWVNIKPDWVVTNPPFNVAIDIVQNAWNQARVGVAMLLRLSFLEPTDKRSLFLVATPPESLLVLPRWSYKQNGKTDSVTTAWMVWLKPTNLLACEGMRPARPLVHPNIQIISKSEM